MRPGRKPERGAAPDRKRWFPPLDATGKPYVTRRERPSPPLLPPPDTDAAPELEVFDGAEPITPGLDDTDEPSSATDAVPPRLE